MITVLLLSALLFGTPDARTLARQVAEREQKCRAERDRYTYRQSFEFTEEGGGGYFAVNDITFTPDGKRIEQVVKKPIDSLKKIRLTEEDFRDLVQVQPLLLEPEDLWNYDVSYGGEQVVAATPAHMLRIKPRQIFEGQRLFDGTVWVSKKTLQIIQAEGKAVPNIFRKGQENLFPYFTTVREAVAGAGGCWFPVLTWANDVLPFRNGPQRVRFTIKYEKYQRFSADVKIEYKE